MRLLRHKVPACRLRSWWASRLRKRWPTHWTGHFSACIKEAGDDLNRRMAATMRAGTTPNSTAAMDLAEEHRAGIERFYECSYEMHRGLADMYLADERFTRTYEDVAAGLAQWVHDAIHANADRNGAGPNSTDTQR